GEEFHRALEVGEQHRHLLALAHQGSPGGQNLLSEVLWGVLLRRGHGDCPVEPVPAPVAEARPFRIYLPAFCAFHGENVTLSRSPEQGRDGRDPGGRRPRRGGQASSPPGSIPCSTSFLRGVLRLMPRICAARPWFPPVSRSTARSSGFSTSPIIRS